LLYELQPSLVQYCLIYVKGTAESTNIGSKIFWGASWGYGKLPVYWPAMVVYPVGFQRRLARLTGEPVSFPQIP